MLDDERPIFARAVECASHNFEGIEEQIGCPLRRSATISYPRMLTLLCPGVVECIPDASTRYFEVDEKAGDLLAGAATSVPEAAEILLEVCAANAYEGRPLPYGLRTASFSLIRGSFPLAKRRGPPVSADFVLNWFLYSTAIFVRDVFSDEKLFLTRNEASEISACDAVVEAAADRHVDIKYSTLRDWCTSKKYRSFRERCNALDNQLKGQALVELGHMKASSVFGPFLELGRMRSRGHLG